MSGSTILIADDDVKLLTALSCRLKDAGYTVLATQDAYQAVAMAVQHRPALMILDVNMPAGTGFSVQQRLASADELRHTAFVYITGEDPERLAEDARACGMDMRRVNVVHKPFDGRELLSVVRNVLDHLEGATEAA